MLPSSRTASVRAERPLQRIGREHSRQFRPSGVNSKETKVIGLPMTLVMERRGGRAVNKRSRAARTFRMRVVTTTLLLRIASVISLLFTAGHTMGGLRKWSPMGDNAVLKAMTDVRFDTMGANRSYLDFFMGFGWSISVSMLMQTILLWQLASLARSDPARLRPMIAVIALATVVSGVIAAIFIFPVPALFSAVLAIALTLAYAFAR